MKIQKILNIFFSEKSDNLFPILCEFMSTAFYTVLLAARSRSISTLRPPKYSVSTGAEMLDLGCFGHAFLETDAGKWESQKVPEFFRIRFENFSRRKIGKSDISFQKRFWVFEPGNPGAGRGIPAIFPASFLWGYCAITQEIN